MTESHNENLPFKAEHILKNYKHLTTEELSLAMSFPQLASVLVSIVTKLNDRQMQTVVPLMTNSQIRSTVPRLQLERNGRFFQAMTAHQVREGIAALPPGDRDILMENIGLLTASSSKEELSSFMAFIDPLAMCIASTLPNMCSKIIIGAGLMTVEQLRLVVSMLNPVQIIEILTVLEEEPQLTVAVNMIDKKEEVSSLLIQNIPKLVQKKEGLHPKLKMVSDQLPVLEGRVDNLVQAHNKQAEYEIIVRSLKNIKADIESLQQSSRDLLATVKVPLRVIASTEHPDPYHKYQTLSTETTNMCKELHNKFSTIDSVINKLNLQWHRINPAAAVTASKQHHVDKDKKDPDNVYEDEDIAITLFQAVQKIGNPTAVGNAYGMSWNDIIQAGFRSSDDFVSKGIENLEQLQRYVDTYKSDCK